MELNKLITNLKYDECINYENLTIGGLSYHSTKVNQGNLFVCIVGHASDGHAYAKSAVDNGAVALVVERFIDEIKVPQIKVKDSRLALAFLSAEFYGHPSKDIKMIGITGTNGKTTTSFFIDSVLEAHFQKTGLIGTVIVKNGESIIPASLTTPESLDLQNYLSEMRNNNIKYTTMEVSSSGLDLNRVAYVDYDIAVVTNISRDHIDLHGSFDNYVKAKKRLVQNLSKHCYAILNGDCSDALEFGKETKAKILTFGFKNQLASVVAQDVDLSKNEVSYTLRINETITTDKAVIEPQAFEVKLQVLGLHNVYNSLVAALVGLILGIDTNTIQKALYKFVGVERRFQLIYNRDFKIIDDHFANPGNIAVTLDTIKRMNFSKFNLIYGVRGCRGVTVNRENAEVIAKYKDSLGLDEVILTTSSDFVGKKDTVTQNELEVVQDIFSKAGIKMKVYKSLKEAVTDTLKHIEKDSLVLLGGCQGMDYGAKVSLEYLFDQELLKLKEEIFAPLKNRVAGV